MAIKKKSNFRVTEISYSAKRTINMGDYSSVSFGYGLTASCDDDVAAKDGIVDIVNMWIDEETRYWLDEKSKKKY